LSYVLSFGLNIRDPDEPCGRGEKEKFSIHGDIEKMEQIISNRREKWDRRYAKDQPFESEGPIGSFSGVITRSRNSHYIRDKKQNLDCLGQMYDSFTQFRPPPKGLVRPQKAEATGLDKVDFGISFLHLIWAQNLKIYVKE